ncbi:MAG: thioredoxin domain-containing protein [Pseudomonadales bacterium]|nr:thioredoxin domain-containing protein [Pseudomonadales bacterium]
MNQLKNEPSLYLQQHASNPVQWHPWGSDALEGALDKDKPILLSIGYSSCHWCHVMAHESFEDELTASVMNENFVNIKVDREERPDIDQIYQTAHQLLTQRSGGWPLTMFLDPKTHLPFFGGTYFPPSPRFNLPGFKDLLMRVASTYRENKSDLATQQEQLRNALAQMTQQGEVQGIDVVQLLIAARDQLASRYDQAHGGFGTAPKFPMPANIDRLLRHWSYSRRQERIDRDSFNMALTTLTRVARGGIYDHVGGGFCRYSTDNEWMIPHFEKMLYDNGTLMSLYADALGLGPDPLFESALRETAEWIVRDMQHPQGGYFTSLDADSNGVEGSYYVWRRNEIKNLLDGDEYLIIETLYGLDKPPNFEGKWNFHRRDAWHSVIERLGFEAGEAKDLLESAKAKLLERRSKRPAPGRDEKILTSWNGLAIKGMAKAAMRLSVEPWLNSSQRAADFIRSNCFDGNRLSAVWNNGTVGHDGFLDDYANLLDGLLVLLEAQWRSCDIEFAQTLAELLLAKFLDDDGGFFFTAHGQDKLIHRPKPTVDDALPPGNGTAAIALLKLGHLLNEPRYVEAAHATLDWARASIEQYPAGHCTLLRGLESHLYSPQQIMVRGPQEAMVSWLSLAREGYTPDRCVYGIPYDQTSPIPKQLPSLVSAETRRVVTAYVCQDLSCKPPITDFEEYKDAIRK